MTCNIALRPVKDLRAREKPPAVDYVSRPKMHSLVLCGGTP